jgi:hypothetical protein
MYVDKKTPSYVGTGTSLIEQKKKGYTLQALIEQSFLLLNQLTDTYSGWGNEPV